MTTENQQVNSNSSISSTNSPAQKLQGWFKLMETIRNSAANKTEQSQLLSKSVLKSGSSNDKSVGQKSILLTMGTHSNTNILRPSETMNSIDSPPNIFNAPSIANILSPISTVPANSNSISFDTDPPTRTTNLSTESHYTDPSISPISSESLNSSPYTNINHVSNTTKAYFISTPITEDISDDDDIPLIDIRRNKTKSIDRLSISRCDSSIIPLATDLRSLPGHRQTEQRNTKFIYYSDVETLTLHLEKCLFIDHLSVSVTNKYATKTNLNVLQKIFKLYYIKTFRRNLYFDEKLKFKKPDNIKQQPLSAISSPTSTSFKLDWNVNRRNITSSKNRQTPKNLFHILQSTPKLDLSIKAASSTTTRKSTRENFESIKDILARTYCPHLYVAVENDCYFGAKSKLPHTEELICTHNDVLLVKEMPLSPPYIEDPMAITLKSPPSTIKSVSQLISNVENENPQILSLPTTNNTIDLSLWNIKPSVVLLTPTEIPIKTKETNFSKKRKHLISDHSMKAKKRIPSSCSSISSVSLVTNNVNEANNTSDIESIEDELPLELPKQLIIKNGLRSYYYKTKTNDKNTKSSSLRSRTEHHPRKLSASLPEFYTGMFELDNDNKPSYNNYCLPYDIYWFNKRKEQEINNPVNCSSTTSKTKKKTLKKPTQKHQLSYRTILRNSYSEQLRLRILSSHNTEKASVCECKPSGTCEAGTCLNRMIFTECTSSCACGKQCTNQKIRKNQWSKHIEVFDTGKYGQGIRATAKIPKGTFICEYVGEIITDDEFQERMNTEYSRDEHHYTMKLTQNLVIDAYRMGNIARFVNHSCSPNCEFQKWTVDGFQRMCMFASRTIKSGEEITYDYNFQCFNLQSQQPCYCESENCRGTITEKKQTSSIVRNNLQIEPNLKLNQREKQLVLQSSIFLMRNIRKIKAKNHARNISRIQSKQWTDKKGELSLIFPQNYYHLNSANHKSYLWKNQILNSKDLFYLFYNHIRRSHFVKTNRHYYELIDESCYYAQLAQLALVLNEIFELIVTHKRLNRDFSPINPMKKCPPKQLYPAYYQVISKPIDLASIRNKLDDGEYTSFNLFEKDILLLFRNTITYFGQDSDNTQTVLDIRNSYANKIQTEYTNKLRLFTNMKQNDSFHSNSVQVFENFVEKFHAKEVFDAQIRETLYDMIYGIDEDSDDNCPVVYKIVHANNVNSHKSPRTRVTNDIIVHCRCGSVNDENSLVQCYACQLWQHVVCVSIVDSSRPYYCFECQPKCIHNPLECLKKNVYIPASLSPVQTFDDNSNSYSTLTRSDGFVVRINESYLVPKQHEENIDKSLTSAEYDILFVERLWIDDYGIEQASGFYYIRPNETFHEPNRKFFPNEVFRYPSSKDPYPISLIVRPCFVLDIGTYCKGKPISDNSCRVLPSDLFICESRVDKLARTFKRLSRMRHTGINTKSYCFDNYVEKLSIKRDYQPYQNEQQQCYNHDNRRHSAINLHKLTNRQIEEKYKRVNGILEKLYRRFHGLNTISNDTEYTLDQLIQPVLVPSQVINQISEANISNVRSRNSSCSSRLNKQAKPVTKRRRTISISSTDNNNSDDDIIEISLDDNNPKPPKRRLINKRTKE